VTHLRRALVAAALLAAPILAPAQDDEKESALAQRNFMKTLAGESGKPVVFETDFNPDGRRSYVRMSQDDATGQPLFIASGQLKLESERLNLKCYDLAYRAADGILTAEGGVEVGSEGMDAKCDSLLYNLETGEVTLDGTDFVSQKTPENEVHFDGMKRFLVTQARDGGKNVRLEGTDAIVVAINSLAEAATGSAEGLSALGKEVRIETKPYGSQPPAVGASLTPESDLQSFNAKGNVRMVSDTFTVLAEELAYDAKAGIFQATGKVYMENDRVKAECGKMTYETATGKVTLGILPLVEVIDEDGQGKSVFSGYDVLSYTPREGQVPDFETPNSQRGRIEYVPIKAPAAPPSGNGAAPAREIMVNP